MPFHKYLPHFLARQFKTVDTSDFPDVVIPLERAQRHHSVVEKAERDGSVAFDGDVEKADSLSDDDKQRRASVAAYDIHTIEGLRAEIDADLTAFGASDTAYDRM